MTRLGAWIDPACAWIDPACAWIDPRGRVPPATGDGYLPAYPMREMCKRIVALSGTPVCVRRDDVVELGREEVVGRPTKASNRLSLDADGANDVRLVEALVAGVGVF